MHGLGNDFAIFDGIRQAINLTNTEIAKIANRHTGIGADQVIIVKPARDDSYDFQYVIYNQDGSEVGQCGNAARCLGVFLAEKGLSEKLTNVVRTTTTELTIALVEDNQVLVDMGVPQFLAENIPMQAPYNGLSTITASDNELFSQQGSYQFAFIENQAPITFSAVALGNPHAVIVVDDVSGAAADTMVNTIGAAIEPHPLFPEKVNVGFMQIINRNEIKLRVFERGVGETQACGSGACAAVVCGIKLGLLDNIVNAYLIGGKIEISWQGENTSIKMKGSATTVFEGEINL